MNKKYSKQCISGNNFVTFSGFIIRIHAYDFLTFTDVCIENSESLRSYRKNGGENSYYRE